MEDFKAITTQEELDKIIGERLQRDRTARQNELQKKYGNLEDLAKKAKTNEDFEDRVQKMQGTIDELNKAVERHKDYDAKIQELSDAKAKIKEYETVSVKQRIAHENGIPYELAGRLTGTTEDELKEDAKLISGFIQKKAAPPLGSSEPTEEVGKDAAYKALLKKMKGE